ncbi:Uma2 family endonuclease [Emticicia oligotrophica]|uniref:Uma2 family endonuclease n=1 Tax=Emticicia oligotrophica TaxID=312279 RepID=UPI00273AA0E2|nr:Uma2 family endonuclease [Emticicia oligotrophica]
MELLASIETKNLQDWDLVQIINGEEIMSPSPISRHQIILSELNDIFKAFTKKKKLGKVLISPLDVIFEEGVNRVQPDLIYISDENKGIIKDWIRGVPDLLVEVVSKDSFYIDTVDKKEIYLKYGVKEYWIIFPEYDTIEVFSLEDEGYKIFSKGTDDEIVKSKLLNGLEVKVSDITA